VLSWVLGCEDLVQFLELFREYKSVNSAVLGLGNEEVDDSGLEEVPDDEDDISLPCDLLQRNGPSELVDKTSWIYTLA
jgi:hypothetical protein